ESYWAVPSVRMQRLPWFLDVRWIAPALIVSTAVVLLTLLAWPVAVLWRGRRKKRWGQDAGNPRQYLPVELGLLVDVAVVVASSVLFVMGSIDPRILDNALDPLLLALCLRMARRLRGDSDCLGRFAVLANGCRQPMVTYPSLTDCREQRHDRVVF